MRRPQPFMRITALVLVTCFCALLMMTFEYHGAREGAGSLYIKRGTTDTGAANLVSAIYLNYRLYDTLFEILVFSTAVLGVRFYLAKRGRREEEVTRIPESQVIRTSADLLFPPILLLGIYLVLFGHISPGGGFSGGTVAGTGLLLCASLSAPMLWHNDSTRPLSSGSSGRSFSPSSSLHWSRFSSAGSPSPTSFPTEDWGAC